MPKKKSSRSRSRRQSRTRKSAASTETGSSHVGSTASSPVVSNHHAHATPAAAADPKPAAFPVRQPAAVSEVHPCHPGPWGNLEFYDTFLEAPDSLIERITLPSQQTVWNFENATEQRLVELFENVGLSAPQKAQLMNRSLWVRLANGIRIFPPHEVIETIGTASRIAIYAVLARSELNPYHRTPFIFDRLDLAEALDRSGLPESLVGHLDRLTYRVGKVLAFSDFPHFLRHLRHPADERRLLRILTRTRTLLVRLNLAGDQDLTGIKDYWTANRRSQSVLPLIESVAVTRGVDTIDIAHFLPSGPRSQIFTYPTHEDCISGRAPDSIWTALNFFNHEPIPVYADSQQLEDILSRGYDPIHGEFDFGDVLLLHHPGDSRPCHGCVHIGDGIVFTKNGPSLMTPWVLSHLENVLHCQVPGSRLEVRAWRRRDL